MKAEHRHELKTNELAQWLANFPQWARENLKMIIYLSVVAILVITTGIVKWYGGNVTAVQKSAEFTETLARVEGQKIGVLQSQSQGVDVSYNLLGTAENLQVTAQETKNDTTAALALIKRAEMLRSELHYRQSIVNRVEVESAINQARQLYSQAVEKAGKNSNLVAMGQLGLGLCAEELDDLDTAKHIYRTIVQNSQLDSTAAYEQAKRRLDVMDDYREKVVFKKTPKPATEQIIIQPDFELPVLDEDQGGK